MSTSQLAAEAAPASEVVESGSRIDCGMTEAPTAAVAETGATTRLADYLELTKPGIAVLVLVVTGVGYGLGAVGGFDANVLLACLAGTGLLGGGASALNQYFERRYDALMARTERRPLAAGRLQPWEGLALGVILGAAGSLVLLLGIGTLACAMGLVTFLSYAFVYTPLKRRTAWALLIGAVPGALPPVIGWSAARGDLAVDAWVIFAIVFAWQIPHFLSISWLYREDYRSAGFPTFATRDDTGVTTARQTVLTILILILVSFVPVVTGLTGFLYVVGASGLGVLFLWSGVLFALDRSSLRARRVLQASLVYLPVLLILIVSDKT